MVKKKAKEPTESAEQIKLINRIRHFHPDITVFAIPNGGNRSAMEATKLKEEGVLAGVADLFVMEPRGDYCGMFIEMKRRFSGTMSDEQKNFQKKARRKGYKSEVAHGADEAWEIFEEYMRLPE